MNYRVAVPIADLRREPVAAGPRCKDPLQETQLLYGEEVELLGEESGGWQRVAAVEQKKFYGDQGWQGYRGWIEKRQLSEGSSAPNAIVTAPWASLSMPGGKVLSLAMGTRLESLKSSAIRLVGGGEGEISPSAFALSPPLQLLLQLEGSPYYWGGCSPHGVDCSGLVWLLGRLRGQNLPRDACDQWLACESCEPGLLEAGDLAFTADLSCSERIDHVLIYLKGETFFEASLSAGCVRKISAEEKWGVTLSSLSCGKVSGKTRIFFGKVPLQKCHL